MTDVLADAQNLLSKRQRLAAQLAEIDQALATVQPQQAEDDDLIPVGLAARRAA